MFGKDIACLRLCSERVDVVSEIYPLIIVLYTLVFFQYTPFAMCSLTRESRSHQPHYNSQRLMVNPVGALLVGSLWRRADRGEK